MGHADEPAALAGGPCQPIVAGISVELEDPVEAAQERFSILATPIGRIEEDNPRWVGAAPVAVVTGQRPEIPGLGPSPPRIEHRRRGLVHEQLGGRLQMFGQPVDDGFEMETCDPDPVGQGAAVDGDARPREHLALAV